MTFLHANKILVSLVLVCTGGVLYAQSMTEQIAALKNENRILKEKNALLESEMSKLKNEISVRDWDVLSGIGDEEDVSGVSSVITQTAEDDLLAARLRLCSPFLIIPFDDRIKGYVDYYTIGKHSQMRSILRRYERYLPEFLRVFEKYGIPEDLTAMAIIESAVSRKAVSPVGAKGMWQLMEGTARDYGLVVSDLNDERFDVDKSTEAAAIHISRLYRMFGKWDLAVLAYNCGERRLNQAIISSGRKTTFWELYDFLPAETRGYLLSIIAVRYAYVCRDELGIKIN